MKGPFLRTVDYWHCLLVIINNHFVGLFNEKNLEKFALIEFYNIARFIDNAFFNETNIVSAIINIPNSVLSNYYDN